MLHSYDDFATHVSLFHIPDRLSRLMQRVASIYHWHDFASCEKLLHKHQILLVQFRNKVRSRSGRLAEQV